MGWFGTLIDYAILGPGEYAIRSVESAVLGAKWDDSVKLMREKIDELKSRWPEDARYYPKDMAYNLLGSVSKIQKVVFQAERETFNRLAVSSSETSKITSLSTYGVGNALMTMDRLISNAPVKNGLLDIPDLRNAATSAMEYGYLAMVEISNVWHKAGKDPFFSIGYKLQDWYRTIAEIWTDITGVLSRIEMPRLPRISPGTRLLILAGMGVWGYSVFKKK